MEAIKGRITYLEPDYNAVEESHLDHWRVHNGEYFTNGFKTKKEAREFAIKNNGIAIAFCTLHNGTIVYTQAEKIDVE